MRPILSEITNGYVIYHNDNKVYIDHLWYGEVRVYDRHPTFDGMRLFRGKEIWLEIVTFENKITVKAEEVDSWRITQLWNYFWENYFTVAPD